MRQIVTILIALGIDYYLLFVSNAGKQLQPQLSQELPKIAHRIQEIPQIPKELTTPPAPLPSPLTAASFLTALNEVRGRAKLPLLKKNSALCPITQTLLSQRQLQNSVIEKSCPLCTSVLSFIFDDQVSSEAAVAEIKTSSMSAIITSKDYRQTCIEAEKGQIAVVTAKLKQPEPTPRPIKEISEEELWQALMIYRDSHHVSHLERDEKMCEYARKRVDDHLKLLAEHKPKDEYLVPAKYPLDAHEGFKKDADSGYVFTATGRQVIAENLAYWPNAEYGIHVIEWGWDTSTEGHKETQLSNDFTVACITGKQGFFVAEFAR